MRTPLYVAKEMGKGLGSRNILQRAVQKKQKQVWRLASFGSGII